MSNISGGGGNVDGKDIAPASVDTDWVATNEYPAVDARAFATGGSGTDADPFTGGIQDAVDALPTANNEELGAGGLVKLGGGTIWEIDSPITAEDIQNIWIAGDGMATIRPSSSFTGSYLIDIHANTAGLIHNAYIRNLVLDGQDQAVQPINMQTVKNIGGIERVRIKDFDGVGIGLNQCNHITLRDVQAQPNNPTGSLILDLDNCNEIRGIEVTLRGNDGAGGTINSPLMKLHNGTVNATFVGLSVANSQQEGIRLDAAGASTNCQYNHFYGTFFENLEWAAVLTGDSSGSARQNSFHGWRASSLTNYSFRLDYAEFNRFYGGRFGGTLTSNSANNRAVNTDLGVTDNGTGNEVVSYASM